MITFLKAQLSSLSASLFDFLTTIILKEVFKIVPLIAGVSGAVAGGIFNFVLNRRWAFRAIEGNVTKQITRYFLVWVGSIALNATGLYLFLTYTAFHYMLSKITVSLLVGVFYNYVLQKKVVFR